MPRPVEWACRLAAEPGTKGWRLARRGDHFDRRSPIRPMWADVGRSGQVFAISNHLVGQAVCDDPIERPAAAFAAAVSSR